MLRSSTYNRRGCKGDKGIYQRKKEAPAHKLGRYWFTPFCPHCGARMIQSKTVRNVGKKESHTKTSSNERTV